MTPLDLMSDARLVERLGWTLVHFLWQGAAIGLATAALLHALHGARAQVRYLVSCASLLLMLTAAAITFASVAPGGPRESRGKAEPAGAAPAGTVRAETTRDTAVPARTSNPAHADAATHTDAAHAGAATRVDANARTDAATRAGTTADTRASADAGATDRADATTRASAAIRTDATTHADAAHADAATRVDANARTDAATRAGATTRGNATGRADAFSARPLPVLLLDGYASLVSAYRDIVTLVDRGLPLLVSLWILGLSVCSIRLLGGLALVRRLKRLDTRPVPPEWQRRLVALAHQMRVPRAARIALRASARAQTAAVIGWVRPVILLPAGALTGLTPQQLEAVLAHELAHVRRHDYLVNLLQTMTETLLFYHPAVWYVSHRIRVEREHCCDDEAVAACGDVVIYAAALTDLEMLRRGAPALAMAAGGGSLLRRVRRLLAPAPHTPSTWSAATTLLALATLFVGVAAVQGPIAAGAQWPPAPPTPPAVPTPPAAPAPSPTLAPPAAPTPTPPTAFAPRVAPVPPSAFVPPAAFAPAWPGDMPVPPSPPAVPDMPVPAASAGPRHLSAPSAPPTPLNAPGAPVPPFPVAAPTAPTAPPTPMPPRADGAIAPVSPTPAPARFAAEPGVPPAAPVSGIPRAPGVAPVPPAANVPNEPGKPPARAMPGVPGEPGDPPTPPAPGHLLDPGAQAARVSPVSVRTRAVPTPQPAVWALRTWLRSPLSFWQSSSSESRASSQREERQRDSFTSQWNDDNRRLTLRGRGEVEIADDDSDIKSLSDRAWLSIEEQVGRERRRIEFQRNAGGGIDRTFLKDGREMSFEPEGRAWLAQALPDILRRTGLAAESRARRILARGGVDGVLNEVSRIPGDFVKKRYLRTLFDVPGLEDSLRSRLLMQAGKELQSDFELASLLAEAANAGIPRTDEQRLAYITATETIKSDFEQRRALKALLDRGRLSEPVLKVLLVNAGHGIESDFELASLLDQIGKSQTLTAGLMDAYVAATLTLDSDFELHRALKPLAALPPSPASPQTLRGTLQAAAGIQSDFELAGLLLEIVQHQQLDDATRPQFFQRVDAIQSDFERARVLKGLTARGSLNDAMAVAIIDATRGMSSAFEISGVLRAVAGAHALTGAPRRAYLAAADRMSSDFERDRTLAALVRTEARGR